MLQTLKLIGLAVGLLGLIVALLNLIGYFVDEEKIHLSGLIRTTEGGIPRATPGFDKVMAKFPPPQGIDPTSVTHIVKDILQTHDKYPISITLRYLAGNQRTSPVASNATVQVWAAETWYGWGSWIIMALAWLTVAVVVLVEIYNPKAGG